MHEALLALKAISRRPSQPWLDGVMEAVRELMADVAAQQKRVGDETATTLARAHQHMEHHHYERVIDELETIPIPLRDASARQLLKQARSSQEEFDSLKEQVRNNTDATLSDRALYIERILALHPDNRPLLARCSDGALRDLAEQELKLPTIPIDQLRLADGWWILAEKKESHEKGLQLRAAYWYLQALSELPHGLHRVKAEMRVRQAEDKYGKEEVNELLAAG